MSNNLNIVVTGGAGFIGSHLIDRLLADGHTVTNIDNFDPFYPREVKERNIEGHTGHKNYTLVEADIRDLDAMMSAVPDNTDVIVHLAAKAGVRPSIEDPVTYQEVNVTGTQNMLEVAKEKGIKQFVFASSSSVYGKNPNVPWREDDHVLQPISPYASTKVSGELLGHVYSHLYDIRFLALRFFTVYGPRQRPDLAIHKFTRLILENKPISMYGDGTSRRDYTYIDDIVEGLVKAISFIQGIPPFGEPVPTLREGTKGGGGVDSNRFNSNNSLYEIINLGNNQTVSLSEMIETIESALDTKAEIDRQPMQPGDVEQTWAYTGKVNELLGFKPETEFEAGVKSFAEWKKFI